MINREQREHLRQYVATGDYDNAAKIYLANTGREISTIYVWMFVNGHKPVTGRKPGSHQPEDIYRAVAEAIAARIEREALLSKMIEQINQSTLAAAQAAAVE